MHPALSSSKCERLPGAWYKVLKQSRRNQWEIHFDGMTQGIESFIRIVLHAQFPFCGNAKS
jgi:hypothetical protein